MSTTAITCELLVRSTRSSDFPFIAGGGTANAIVATAAADGWVVSPPSGLQFDERLIFIFGSDGSGGTVTLKAGDRYPAQRADLGDEIITLAANDGRVVQPEVSRFLQNDGTINVIPSTTGLVITAVMSAKAP
jgi:hypothetical protein